MEGIAFGNKCGEEGRVKEETKETGGMSVRDGRERGQDGYMDDGGLRDVIKGLYTLPEISRHM